MDTLEIKGKQYEIKFNHRFYDRVISSFAKKHKKADVDGFNNLIAGLIANDPDAVIRAYRCAIVGKTLPTTNDVSDALDDAGIFNQKDIYAKIFKELKASGFLAGKIHLLLTSLQENWKNSEIALKVATENSDKSDKDYKKNLRAAQMEVAFRKQEYELAKNQLAELNK